MDEESIKNQLQQAFPEAKILVTGDGRHFDAQVISDIFEGKSRITRHRMVYEPLGNAVGVAIHALSVKAMTPEEWVAATK